MGRVVPFNRTGIKHKSRKKLFKKGKRKRRPRNVIKTSPFASPNVHMFKRSYDNTFSIGAPTDETNGIFRTSDAKYMILQLHTKFNKLHDYTDFKTLFSEYKITSITHKLVPYFTNNQPAGLYGHDSTNTYVAPIPNYEVFCLPVSSSARQKELETKTGPELDEMLNRTQRKSRRIMPNKTHSYTTMKPMVVEYKGPLSKSGGNALMAMARSGYLNTDAAPLVTGGVDQTDVAHYGITLLIRRVDGEAFPDHSNVFQPMGFRMENNVYFKCRKVQ